MSSFDGEVPVRSAMSVTIGINTATIGVLLTKPAVLPASPIVAASCRHSSSPVSAISRSPRQ
ncbi:hypothetical protein C446_10935 [Halobiforma nitratireducens JCM 10879]|uniref:Uncharacterized protein n=1 Tax=Halobiforma nitratireducens JCM 10879 TaxID=1227454 RepID=M0LYM9_9EURY|nr:hypothetical protein C446_10935 [Halobiforma nitratireducens JCM 10879]